MSLKKLHKLKNKEAGQLSIFLGIVLLVVITLLAFVINVGLFVKAKINLQNSVDAAAYAGAATQARQLSQVGYLNWELRNTFKEWMFKYYIIGQRGNTRTHVGSITSPVNFRLRNLSGASSSGLGKVDPYNVPSVCIHYGSSHNICSIYTIPGLPRFSTVGLPDVAEYFESALDNFVKQKARACSERTDLNFAASMIWAYGTKGNSYDSAPMIAAHKVGAWPQAIELGFRVRNIEDRINRPPVSQPICMTASGTPCTTVQDLDAEFGDYPKNERPIKAFMSAFKNLSGGNIKDNGRDKFAASFTLTELSPSPYDVDPTSLGAILYPSNGSSIQKHYVDLLAMPINYATFFHSFIANESDSDTVPDVTAPFQATCGVSKTALPVPGYLTGFFKNPEVLTYYAVRGEAKYTGLFFPFTEQGGIEMKAYAAAKPFGGRIGPMLYSYTGGSISARNDNPLTNDYVTGIRSISTPYQPGFPIPHSAPPSDYWINNPTDIIGGSPRASIPITYSIPNMLYDIRTSPRSATALIENLDYASSALEADNPSEQTGFYNQEQFEKFASNLPTAGGAIILDAQTIDQGIENARQPTLYEALNYMIPHYNDDAAGGSEADAMDSLSPLMKVSDTPSGNIQFSLFAPLYGPGTLYPEISNITTEITTYLDTLRPSVQEYLDALKATADSIKAGGAVTGIGGSDKYNEAANTIHGGNLDAEVAACPGNGDKISIAAKFKQFFFRVGAEGQCGIYSLPESITRYFNTEISNNTAFTDFYVNTYKKPDNLSNPQLATGYSPGPRQGNVKSSGFMTSTSGGNSAVGFRRNYYSTKFVGVGKLDGTKYSLRGESMYVEGTDGGFSNFPRPSDLSSAEVRNMLQPGQLSEFGELFF